MIILVTFIIFVLIIFIAHKSNKDNISENPNYREIFFWQKNNKAYSLLLHSVIFYSDSFSAYSSKWDSLMIFQALPSELYLIKNKLQDYSFNKQQCLECHKNGKASDLYNISKVIH